MYVAENLSVTPEIAPPTWDFDALAARLACLPAGTRFLDFPGNAGDALIACGTHQVFEAHGLRLVEHPVETPLPDGASVVIAGGGNFVPYYDHVAAFLEAGIGRLGQIVLLPNTVRGNEDLLSRLPSTCLIVVRDLESYAHCEVHLQAAELALCPDMAFAWTRAGHRAALRSALPSALTRPYAWRYLAKCALAFRQARALRRAGGRLYALRTDAEATGRAVPEGNIDLSEVFRPRRVDRVNALMAVEALCRFMEPFEEVETSRLHIAVMAAHLGKRVKVSDNAYGKLRAVLALAPEALRDRISFE
ncbi:MAG: polysaccharide pyruvyl transferase family protein [Pseudomonadota bacterium]